MNQRRVVVMLAWCLINWFCVLLVSAEEDDTRIPPATVTTTTEQQHDVVMGIADNDSQASSEINETYPKEEFRSQDDEMNDQIQEDDLSSELDDAAIETAQDEEDHVVVIQQEEELLDVVTSSSSSSHEDQRAHDGDSIVAPESTDTMAVPSNNEETMEDAEVGREEGYDDTYPTEGTTDEMETESTMPVEGEREETNSSMEQIQDMEERREETQHPEESVGTSDEISVEFDESENVESNSAAIEDTVIETESLSHDPPHISEDFQPENDQDGEAMGEEEVEEQSNYDLDIHDESASNAPEETSPGEHDVEEQSNYQDESSADENVDIHNESAPNAPEETSPGEHDVEEQSNYQDESSADENVDIHNESASNAPEETSPETDSSTEEEPAIDNATGGDDESTTSKETTGSANEHAENNEESQNTSNEYSAAESTPSRDEPIESNTESDVIDFDVIDLEHSRANAPDTPAVEEDHSSTESTESVSQNHDMAEETLETTTDQQQNTPSESSSYRGFWGTQMVGSRPPDMELLYHVFESRIQEKLGIGPIPESELREHIFPLGIGYDDEADTEDEDTEGDDGDDTAPSRAKHAGDVNSDFVEGLDDIDKFFEGVDPPDELDVGASGSSMQDMLMKKGKEILIKRFLMGIKLVKEGFLIARNKVSARFSELKDRDIDFKEIAKTVVSKTTHAYEAVVAFVDKVLDFGNDDEAAVEDFEDFKRKTMEELQQQDVK